MNAFCKLGLKKKEYNAQGAALPNWKTNNAKAKNKEMVTT